MRMWLGRLDLGTGTDEPVAVAMTCRAADVLGVYGVATIERARGQGVATTMTRTALGVDLERPAILQPSGAAEAIYRRIGFTEIGRFSHWG